MATVPATQGKSVVDAGGAIIAAGTITGAGTVTAVVTAVTGEGYLTINNTTDGTNATIHIGSTEPVAVTPSSSAGYPLNSGQIDSARYLRVEAVTVYAPSGVQVGWVVRS